MGSCWCPHRQGTCSLPTSDPLVVGLSLHPMGIFVLLSLQPATAGPGFCAFASFSSLYFPASFTKTPILPSPCPGDLHRKLTLNMAKERPGRPGRGSSHKMWCVALCVPFVIPLHNELPRPPTSLGLTQVPHPSRLSMRQRAEMGMLSTGSREHSLCAQTRGNLGRMEIAMFPQQQKAPCIPTSPQAERWGSLRQSPSINPALTAFNMLMTLSRAGAALCKTHVQPSVMDICSETQC